MQKKSLMLTGGDWLSIIIALVRMLSQANPLKSGVRWANAIKVACMHACTTIHT